MSSKAPSIVLAAVKAQLDVKEAEVADVRNKAEVLEKQLELVKRSLGYAEHELNQLREFLAKHESEEAPDEEESVSYTLFPRTRRAELLRGRDIRHRVTEIAKALLLTQQHFSVDEVLKHLEADGVQLQVEKPPARISQILSTDDFFEYDEEERAWKSKSPDWLHPAANKEDW